MTISEIKEYARKEMRHIRTGIKDEFKEEHYNILIYKICELLDKLEPNNINQAIKVIENEKEKLKYDVDKHQIDSCIFEIKNILGLGAKENNKWQYTNHFII